MSLQPYNQWEPEGPESEGYPETAAADDALVYDTHDHETEEENEAWFDQFIKSGSVGSSVAPTELDPSTPKPPEPAEKEIANPARPVARPLAHPSGGSDVMMIEDSPVKIEDDGRDEDKTVKTKDTKLEEIERLRAQLSQLQIQACSAQ